MKKIMLTNNLVISFQKKAAVWCVMLLSIPALQSQTLEDYIQKAQTENPQIKSLVLNYKIAAEKEQEVNTLPNTQISAGYFVSEPETRTGAQKAKFSVKQAFPWFGTISAEKNFQNSLAETALTTVEIAERKMALTITSLYYQLYTYKAKEKVIDENLGLLHTYEDLMLNAVQTGKTSAVDVLKLQVRQNDLQEQKAVLQGDYLAAEAKFNILLNQDEGTALVIPDSLVISEDIPTLAIDELEEHPELKKYNQLSTAVEQSEKVNAKKSLPELAVGIDYIAVEERPGMDFSGNGKDIVMPMVSVSIPIFNHKYKSVSQQLQLQKESLHEDKEERRNELETMLQTAIQQKISARISYETQQKNLKQTNQADHILRKQFETGTIDYTDILDFQELQLKFQLKQIEAVHNYYIQESIINYLNQ